MTYKMDPKNARKHTPRNKEAVRKSLEQFKAGRSILVDNEDVAIAGNTVLEQAEELGMEMQEVESDGTKLIVVVRDDLKPGDPERDGLAIADNRTAELAQWDFDRLGAQIESLMESDLSLSCTGFSPAEAAILLSDDEFGGDDEKPERGTGGKEKNYLVTIVAETQERAEAWLTEHGLDDYSFKGSSHTMAVRME